MNYRSIIFFLFTWIIIPTAVSSKDVVSDNKLPEISAHRGASRYAPENTLAAFSKAIELGANFLEVDVRSTLDGFQVCLHDASLKRTTGLDKKVSDINFKELQEVSAGNWFADQFANEKIPTLEALCALVRSENEHRQQPVKLYVDCKDIDALKVLAILKAYALRDSAVFYGDLETLEQIKKLFPAAKLLPAFPGEENALAVINRLKPYGFDVTWNEITPGVVEYCHEKGIKVFSDLLDEDDTPLQYSRAIEMGVDVIQTDDITGVQKELSNYKVLLAK